MYKYLKKFGDFMKNRLGRFLFIIFSAILVPAIQTVPASAQNDIMNLSAADEETAKKDLEIYNEQRKKLGMALFYQFNERYRESFPLLKEMAQQDNPVAAYYYAEALYNGWGTYPPNQAKAEEIFSQGIKRITAMKKRGDGLISYTLYYAYLKGHGKPMNMEKAMRWLDISVEQGYGLALFDKAQIEEKTGRFQEAMSTYLKSAETDNPEANFRLGLIYEKGENGVMQNYPQALNYYSKAARRDHTKAEANLGNLYYNGLGTAQNFAEALRLFQKAAGKGNAAAMNGLGVMALRGEGGMRKSTADAFKYFSAAARSGDSNALKNLGNMYYNGIGVDADKSRAFDYYRQSAMKDNPDAMYKVAVMYERGIGVEKNQTSANRWYDMLERKGYDVSSMRGGR